MSDRDIQQQADEWRTTLRDLEHQWAAATDAPKRYSLLEQIHYVCPTCESYAKGGGFGPGHLGSPRCKSGSLAAGGTHSHCSCDTCF